VNGAKRADIRKGILAAYKLATDAKLYDLSRSAANLPSWIPGNVSCVGDTSPPWAYFRGDEDCVASLRQLPLIEQELGDFQVPQKEKVTPTIRPMILIHVAYFNGLKFTSARELEVLDQRTCWTFLNRKRFGKSHQLTVLEL
jgi:hypothetical protein